MTGKFGIGLYTMQPGLGFGYDVAVLDDPVKIGSSAGKGSYLWDGLAGTWFWIDPTNDLVFVGMVQRIVTAPGMPNLEDLSRALVYQALVEPEEMIEAALLAALVAAGSMQAAEASRASTTFRELLDEDWEARLREDPRLATETGDHRYDDRLPSVAPADLERAAQRQRATLARLQAIARTTLAAQDRISYDMLARRAARRRRRLRSRPVAAAHQRRQRLPHAFAELPRHMTLATTRDYENYIARLRAFPAYVAQQIAYMREGLRTGFTLPRVVLDGYDVTIRTHVVDDPEKSVFYAPFRAFPPGGARERARTPASRPAALRDPGRRGRRLSQPSSTS